MTYYRVWYMRPGHFRDGIMGLSKPTVATLADTHVAVRFVHARNLDGVYALSQGEVWSPNGEARDLLMGLGIHHTSMSVGDVIENVDDGQFSLVAPVGFTRLT